MLQFTVIDYLYLFFAALTIYFFSLYMVLHARHRKQLHTIQNITHFPFISLLIPAYNEEKTIKNTLESILNLEWPKNKREIIVVDDGSTDNTLKILKLFKEIKVITQGNGGRANALNAGMHVAKGEFVARVDADSYPESDSLVKMMPYFEDKKVAAVTGTILVNAPKNLLQKIQAIEYKMISWNRKLLEFLEGIYTTPGALSIYRISAIKEIGLFDESNITEDIEISWRLQRHHYKLRACLGARIYTTPPATFRTWWKQRLRWHIGGEQTLFKHFSVFWDKNNNKLKTFIAPLNIFSYVISILGVSTFIYLIGSSIYEFLKFHIAATGSGISLVGQFQMSVPVFLPNVFLIFGIAVFVSSSIYLYYGSKTVDQKRIILEPKEMLQMLVYLTAYVFVFPLVLLHSFWRFALHKF